MNSKLLSLVALCLTITPLPLLSESAVTSQAPLKVGVILPLSGDSASIGVSIKNGMSMAYEKLAPATQQKLELVFEDDQLNAAKTVAAFQKLTSGGIDALVTAYSGPSKAVSSLSEQRKIPHIAIASDPDIVRGKRYPVNFWVTPETEAETAMAEALRRGYKRIARITANQQGFLAIKSAFDRLNKGRLEVALDEEYNPEVKDFRTFIAKLKNRKDLDAILVLLMVNGQVGLFAKQARDLNVQLPLFNIEGFEDANEQKLAEGALAGQWYATNDDPSADFTGEYERRFPGASIFAAGNGHDAVLLLAWAAEKQFRADAIRDFLHTVKGFRGVLGEYSATEDNRFSLPAAVKVVK